MYSNHSFISASVLLASSNSELKAIGKNWMKEDLKKHPYWATSYGQTYLNSGLSEEERQEFANWVMEGYFENGRSGSNTHDAHTMAKILIDMQKYVLEVIPYLKGAPLAFETLSKIAIGGSEPEKEHARFMIPSIFPEKKGVLLHARSVLSSPKAQGQAQAAKVVIEYAVEESEKEKAFGILVPLNRKGKPLGGMQIAKAVADEAKAILQSQSGAYKTYAKYVMNKFRQMRIFEEVPNEPGRVRMNPSEIERRDSVRNSDKK